MSPQKKNLVIVRSVLDQHQPVSEVARRFHTSRQWIYTLIDRYQTYGPEGLDPRPRTPRTSPQRVSPAVTERILTLRQQLTAQGADAGPETLAWYLHQEGLHTPSTSTIRRILHRAGMITPNPRKRPRNSYHRFEATLPNECWQADITHWFLANSTRIEILDFLDDHSRYLLYLRARTSFTGDTVVAAMNDLISTYGTPASTLTDNGLVFTARFARFPGARNGFEKLLEARHIKQKNGRPGHPQTQGKIERFHQTLKRWLAARPKPRSVSALQALLDEFRTWYNHHRPHRAINRRTPHQAYTHLPKATPSPHANTEPEWRTRSDKVDKTGKISIRYAGKLRHLGIGHAHKRKPVLMLICDNHVITSDANTGEVLAEHFIDPNKNYQPAHH